MSPHQRPTARERQCRRLIVKPRRVDCQSSSGEDGIEKGVLAIGHDRGIGLGEENRKTRRRQL
jgi:hypothetical protein